jgi:putative peptide zinc metalloprotease protein
LRPAREREEINVAIVETRVSVWEALAGRAPGQPAGPGDPGLWSAVAERLNPVRARPRLRAGIEEADLVSARGVPYVMLRSPDAARACYLRLTPDELALARLMDGTRTVARLVAEFARISGRLAPDQVTRVVADLAGNRMLEELPVDAFRPLARTHRRPWPIRLGRGLLAAARGRRVVLASIDPLVGFLYRFGGRLLFTRVAAVLCGIVALAGLGLFGWTWVRGDQSAFLLSDSYPLGALALLGLNVLALACHELGHALATKHAGRRVPSAGFLVYFGIPSVFVDTTDVWMAGRRARLITTAAGPATGLVLAGAAQLVGLAFPPLAPWVFKLSFAWYLNALFNLNPFLALDGYYLLMDWLEVPNLRARGMAWVLARLRRRPPAFGQLDREGRLIAIYGMIAMVWLVIAANLAYRIYADRVRGLITGLWRAGWPARLLLAAVVAGLAAPLVYLTFGWLARRWRLLLSALAERRHGIDAPRRLRALQASPLGALPPDRLAALAGRSRWVHPRIGSQLIFAGAAQPDVYVVADGALEARRPGDPSGTVRERVGPGGVVGLAAALSGAPAALAWHTAGTKLLAVPAAAVADAVGPLSGPPPAERAELDTLLAEAPALAALAPDDRLALATRAHATPLPPGAPVILADPGDAAVVASGVITMPDGVELRRGALIGPAGEGHPSALGAARTPARVWTLPALGGRALLLGRAVPLSPEPGAAPGYGAHPAAGYPPLAVPPGPPPSDVDDSVDRRFERRLWWLLLLLLLFALLISGVNLVPGLAWAEMPSDRALLHIDRGRATVRLAGTPTALRAGDQAYVRRNDAVSLDPRSGARLTFRGGSTTVLCAGSELEVGRLVSDDGRPIQPAGALALTAGRLLADTAGTSSAFHPLRLTVTSAGATAANDGRARFAVAGGGVEAAEGTVTRDGSPLSPTGEELTCGDGAGLPAGGPGSPGPSPSDPPSGSPSAVPSDSPSPSPSPSESPTPALTTPGATGTPTARPTTGRTTPAPPPPTTNPPPPRDTTPPLISGVRATTTVIYPTACGGSTAIISATVTDVDDPPDRLTVSFTYQGRITGTVPMSYNVKNGRFEGQLGPFDKLLDSTLSITVSALDDDRNAAVPAGGPTITTRSQCPIP